MKLQLNFKFVIYCLLFFVVSGFLWNYYYLFDLFSHFYLQFFVVCCIFLIWYICKKLWLEVALSVILWAFLLYHLIPCDFTGIYRQNVVPQPDLFYMNSEYMNSGTQEIVNYILEIQPKQIALVELNQELFDQVKEAGGYSYSYYYPDAVFSFGFFTNEEVLEQRTYMSWRYPIWYFRTKEKSYYVVHPLPPMSEELYEAQKTFFKYVTELVANQQDFIVVGDYNSTPFSRVFQTYFGKYYYQSVYSWWVWTPLTIPIDHAISDKNLTIQAGSRLTSDHIPLLITF